jgi:hypothetical protein
MPTDDPQDMMAGPDAGPELLITLEHDGRVILTPHNAVARAALQEIGHDPSELFDVVHRVVDRLNAELPGGWRG